MLVTSNLENAVGPPEGSFFLDSISAGSVLWHHMPVWGRTEDQLLVIHFGGATSTGTMAVSTFSVSGSCETQF